MKKELGKWLMDIAKYVLPAVVVMSWGYHQPSVYKEDGMCTAPQKLDTFGVFFMKYLSLIHI